MPSLLTPLSKIRGVGPATAKKFQALGLSTVQDALWYFPFRHEDWRHLTTIRHISAGQEVTLLTTIDTIASRRSWRRRGLSITEARVTDDGGETFLAVIWFNQPYLGKTLKAGDRLYLYGEITENQERLQMTNPSFERPSAIPAHDKLVPIYRSTAGLSQRQIRLIMKQAVSLTHLVPDPLPSTIRDAYGLPPLSTALETIHFPDNPENAAAALRRLKLDELIRWRLQWQDFNAAYAGHRAVPVHFHEPEIRSFVRDLPFSLTDDQRIAVWQIIQDMQRPQPMYRLLQGDVGSGKTVVAAMVAYNTCLDRQQAVVLAPTVILADQHFATFSCLFAGRELTVGLLTANGVRLNTMQRELPRRDFLAAVARGEIDVLIGTHAILNDELRFARLGLVIVDEQQRFGVNQRDWLTRQGNNPVGQQPHFLSLTATPIPRTVALFILGHLAATIMKQRPAGRGLIQTELVTPDRRATIDEAIAAAIGRNEQVYVVTPLIEESDTLGVRAATVEYDRLRDRLSRQNVGLVHGSMPADDRIRVLEQFRAGQIDVLVGTTVVEVGLDVPNATLIVIEGAERFGLAQLHQLRGRVGRSTKPSRCLLATDRTDATVVSRLQQLTKLHDGFAIAQLDLAERGGGEMYGLRQSGLPDWQLATLEDADLMAIAGEMIAKLSREYPEVASQLGADLTPAAAWHRE